ISGDTIVQTLNPAEKEALRKVLSFYDYLQTDETVLYQDIYNDNTNPEPAREETINPPLQPKPIVNQPPTPTQAINNTNTASPQSPSHNGIANNIPTFSPKPIPRMPVPTRSSAPIVLTAKPAPIPKNLVNLKQPE
ncbi:MAG: hypothetical protein WD512_14800, partial [Candidatus Paceibacterota bacterium]